LIGFLHIFRAMLTGFINLMERICTNMPIPARDFIRTGVAISIIMAGLKCDLFLISNALFWIDVFHADGLRVDAVASMLYLDYSRKEGEWIPNEYGGNENLEAINFLKEFNEVVYGNFPDALLLPKKVQPGREFQSQLIWVGSALDRNG
jgi:hypothetical protein